MKPKDIIRAFCLAEGLNYHKAKTIYKSQTKKERKIALSAMKDVIEARKAGIPKPATI